MRENIRLREKYNNTLSACSVCQTVQPWPMPLKLWADKASFYQITCKNCRLYVPPTYFTRNLHLLTLQNIIRNLTTIIRDLRRRGFFLWVGSCLYTRVFSSEKKGHLKQSRSVKPLFYYLIFSLIWSHSVLDITLTLCFHRLDWKREFVWFYLFLFFFSPTPFTPFPFHFTIITDFFIPQTGYPGKYTHMNTQVHMCSLWSVSLAARECLLSVCQAPGQS